MSYAAPQDCIRFARTRSGSFQHSTSVTLVEFRSGVCGPLWREAQVAEKIAYWVEAGTAEVL
jgi:hypothetical protein